MKSLSSHDPHAYYETLVTLVLSRSAIVTTERDCSALPGYGLGFPYPGHHRGSVSELCESHVPKIPLLTQQNSSFRSSNRPFLKRASFLVLGVYLVSQSCNAQASDEGIFLPLQASNPADEKRKMVR